MLNPERVASTLGPRARSVAEAYRRLEEEGEPGLAEGARAGTVGVGIMATALKELGNELEGVSPEVQGALKRELVPLFDAGLKTLEVHSAMLDHYTFATKHKVHSTTGAWYAPWTWGDDPTTPTNENP